MFIQLHPIPFCPPNPQAVPTIIWDFDTANVGSGQRLDAAIQSIVGLCRAFGIGATPNIIFCYTRKAYPVKYPGREQVITSVLQCIPRELATVREYSSVVVGDFGAARIQVRERICRKMREHQECGVGGLLLLITGDPQIVQRQRHLRAMTEQFWSVVHVCSASISEKDWYQIATELPTYWWHFHRGILSSPYA